MGSDLTGHRRSSYFSACMSPSCVPVVHEEYSRIDFPAVSNGRSRRWRKLIKKLLRESGKSFYGSKPPTSFKYDAVSYSQNFDDGCHKEEYYNHYPQAQVVREFSWHIQK